ncbi:MAG: hypothetical protein ACRDRR_09545 [Pseudonocardiaceae bacterium]
MPRVSLARPERSGDPSLSVLACPIGMGVMMVMMARGKRSDSADSPADASAQQELIRLCAGVEQLKAERAHRG